MITKLLTPQLHPTPWTENWQNQIRPHDDPKCDVVSEQPLSKLIVNLALPSQSLVYPSSSPLQRVSLTLPKPVNPDVFLKNSHPARTTVKNNSNARHKFTFKSFTLSRTLTLSLPWGPETCLPHPPKTRHTHAPPPPLDWLLKSLQGPVTKINSDSSHIQTFCWHQTWSKFPSHLASIKQNLKISKKCIIINEIKAFSGESFFPFLSFLLLLSSSPCFVLMPFFSRQKRNF